MMQEEAREVLEFLGPARRYADPDGPREGRLMAARGALPLPPVQLASVVFALSFDADPEVKEAATRTLQGFPDRVIDPVLQGEAPPPLLHHLAERFRDDEAREIKIAINPRVADRTLCFLAALPHRTLIDTIAENQVAILRCAEIVEVLGENPLTGQATIDRILEFLGLMRSEAPPLAHDRASEAAPGSVDPDDTSGLPPEALEDRPAPATEKEGEASRQALYALIQNLRVVDKVKLARFGNQEARGLLVRDRNRIVASAAIRSPKLTDPEVLAFAKARNISEEVIRILANNREWTRSYPVQHALATNPKTPIASALKFLNYLSDRDLVSIVRARDVPGPVCQQARRILQRKGKM
jgi:hypothetical protein